MRQEVGDHKGEVIQRKTRRTTQRTDNGALLLGGFPRELVRAAGVVLAVARTALAPLADGLGRDAIAPSQNSGWLPRSSNLGPDSWGGASLGVDRGHQRVPRTRRPARTLKAPGIRLNRPTHLIPATFRYQTA